MILEIPRKLMVCAKNGCRKCDIAKRIVPRNCPFAILHPLDTRTLGVQKRDRRTGKTGELVGIANELCEAGYLVYFLCLSLSMCDHVKNNFRCHSDIVFTSVRRVDGRPYMRPGIVLADEIINEKDMERISNILVSAGHVILAHYYTPIP